MSGESIKRELRSLTDSGRLDPTVAKEAEKHPMAAETLIRLENIEQSNLRLESSNSRLEQAVFGDTHMDPPGDNMGLLHDVKTLKMMVWRSVWIVAGGLSVGGFFIGTAIAIVGLLIQYAKK